MKPEELRNFLSHIGDSKILTTNRKYFLEVCLLLIFAIFIVNWISPKSNALYFLLVFPAILIATFLIYLFTKVMQRPEMGIPIIAIFLPFERIGAINSSSFNIRLSQVFVILALISYIIILFLKNKDKIGGFKIKKDPSFIFLILFALVNIVSLSIAPNKPRSIYVLGFDLFIFFVYLFLSNLLISKDILEKTIKALLFISIILCLFGIYQFIADMINFPLVLSGLREGYTKAVFGFPRVMSTESEPQFWGNFLLIPVSISFSVILAFLSRKRRKQNSNITYKLMLLSVITFILCLINILLTFSRGAWYASVVCIFFIMIFFIRSFINIKTIMITLLSALVILGGFILVLTYSKAPLTLDKFTQRAISVQDSDRAITTNDAVHYFEANKILGIGVGSFGPKEAPNIYQKPQAFGLDIGWRIVNNEYLEILTETGIIGFISFIMFILSVIFSAFRSLIKTKDAYTSAIIVGLFASFIGILVQYVGFSTLYVMQVWFLIAILSAVSFNINSGLWKK